MEKKNLFYRFPVVIEKDADGYFAWCHNLQGCYTQGDSYEEVMKNIREVVKGHIEDRLANGETISGPEEISFTTLDIAVFSCSCSCSCS
jgi:predicted RNase H-like HicB family nuclease